MSLKYGLNITRLKYMFVRRDDHTGPALAVALH